MAGIYTNGLPVLGTPPAPSVVPPTALIAVDTQVASGGGAETIAVPYNQLASGGAQFTQAWSATPGLNWQNGNIQSITLTGNITSMAAPLNPVDGITYYMVLQQDGTGNRTWVPPTSFKFPGGVSTLSTAANAIDFVQAVYNAARGIYLCTLDKALA